MKRILFVVMLFFSTSTFAQNIDDEAIFRDILNTESENYYPAIFSRYMAGDTTLTLDNYRHLYYGYAWHDKYKPLEIPAEKAKLLTTLSLGDKMEVGDYLSVIENANKIMESEPFSPSNINFLTFAYGSIGDTVNEKINAYRLKMITEAIKSSGTGLKESSPWHTLSFSDSADIMALMQQTYGKRMVVSRSVEYFPLFERNAQGVKGYYFNYERVYRNRPETQPQKSNWQFNGIPIKKRTTEYDK